MCKDRFVVFEVMEILKKPEHAQYAQISSPLPQNKPETVQEVHDIFFYERARATVFMHMPYIHKL